MNGNASHPEDCKIWHDIEKAEQLAMYITLKDVLQTWIIDDYYVQVLKQRITIMMQQLYT